MDERNRPALGFLLVGIGLAGRALMAVPEGVGMAELALGALMVIGYVVLIQKTWVPAVVGVACLVLELYLSNTAIDPTELSTVLLRLGDLWLMSAAVTLTLRAANAIKPELFGKAAVIVPAISELLLVALTVTQIIATLKPDSTVSGAASVLFVVFSVSLLPYTVLLLRAYNALRIKKDRRPHL